MALRTIHSEQLATVTGGFDFGILARRSKGQSQQEAKDKARVALASLSGGLGGDAQKK